MGGAEQPGPGSGDCRELTARMKRGDEDAWSEFHERYFDFLVRYARHYARLVFDRPLHDRLLQQVMAAQTARPGLTLSNTLAKEQARRLLAEADGYF